MELIYNKFGSVAGKSRPGSSRTVFRHTCEMSGAHGPQEWPCHSRGDKPPARDGALINYRQGCAKHSILQGVDTAYSILIGNKRFSDFYRALIQKRV